MRIATSIQARKFVFAWYILKSRPKAKGGVWWCELAKCGIMLILPLALNDSAEQAFYVHFADALTEKCTTTTYFHFSFALASVGTHPLPGTSPHTSLSQQGL